MKRPTEFIQVGNIPIFFCNTNKEMGLTGHCHHAVVAVKFQTLSNIGYPSFWDTNNVLRERIQNLKLKGFPGTNEQLVRFIHEFLRGMSYDFCNQYKGKFRVYETRVEIHTVHDENNHDNGVSVYTINEPDFTREEMQIIAEYNAHLGDALDGMSVDYYTANLYSELKW